MNISEIHGTVLQSCRSSVQFFVANGELSCISGQLSAEMDRGVPLNIASCALLTYMIAHITNLRPGDLKLNVGDAHVYLNKVEPLNKQLMRIPRPFPQLMINRQITEIKDFNFEDFEALGYNPYPNV